METGGLKGNVRSMTHKKSMKLFKSVFFFFLLGRKQKGEGERDKESLEQNASALG